MPEFRYLTLADEIEHSIRCGTYHAGERLPSIRKWRAKTQLSISTICQALLELERRGMIASRPKSGYFIRPLREQILPPPQTRQTETKPGSVTINNLAFAILEAMGDPEILQLGGSVMSPELMPGKALARCVKSVSQDRLAGLIAVYEHPMGHLGLRRCLAQCYTALVNGIQAEDILITNGCFEAVATCLRAVAEKGDVIVVESPTFPWYLQLIEDLGMLALEIPTDPTDGIDLSALKSALDHNSVKAAVFNSNFQNPLGFVPPDDKKRALVRLFNERQIPIIEDDIYGELYFGRSRPSTLKSFDTRGLVLYCSSFSKTLAPGLRVGWCMPGRFLEKVRRLKLYLSISSPTLTQEAVYRYLSQDVFERHLRKLRTKLQRQMADMTLAVARHFPKGTRISAPQGGLTIWVQLDRRVDSLELFRRALKTGIAVLPGIICANTDAYRHCIRISCGLPFDEYLDNGVRNLGTIIAETISVKPASVGS
ncbi:PLP-dependent aminotransferase family protein [Desulfonatronum lacustre]|uniref:aminotransferase-like domain-containing protein n=1 Tax=Desulfonatronum lacustre TaxID=66849 RepID=UPI00146FB71F|nr:PLP-dependent aminotransferase family protein [Desulfonatronum lacustre]